MTTKNILFAAGSAALLASFAFAQDPAAPPPPPDPTTATQQAQPADPQVTPAPPSPATPAPAWRRFGDQQPNQAQNAPPPPGYYPQQQPAYQGAPPPQQQGQPGPYYGPQGGYPQGGYPQGNGTPNYRAYPPQQPMTPIAAHVTMPAGVWIKVHIDRVLSSNHNKAGDLFTGTLAQPIIVDGFVVARRGQNITGRVTQVAKAGRVKGTSEISLEINEIALADGQQLPVKTTLVEYHGPTTKGNDAFAIGGTTVLGAAIGGAVNGGVGAGVGAAAGLVASTIGVLSTRGRPTVIFPESLLTFKTVEPVPFSTERSTYSFVHAGPQDYAPAMQTTRSYGPRPYGAYGYAPYGYPYAYGYPYYGYPYPYYGGGIFIGGRFGRHW
ncbi:MAG TPA: hypothetical protein VGL53_31760 [Bryobacteraceae bacterium]|jgi:hypothetical protein